MKTVRKLAGPLIVVVLLGMMLVGASCGPHDFDSFFGGRKPLVAQDYDLKSTTIVATPQQPIRPGKNVIWCGTFQLAWNEIGDLIKEPPRFLLQPPMVDALNNRTFTRDDLDRESYVALAGFVRDGIFGRIDSALAQTFKGKASPRFKPSFDLTPRPQDIVAYSYLFKHLEFPVPFEKLSEPLVFAGSKVESFGTREFKSGHQHMYEQVAIFDYQNQSDFVVDLAVKDKRDRLILAKVRPAATLAETIAEVQRRLEEPPVKMTWADVLVVPKFNFDVTRNFRELRGLHLVSKDPAVAKDLQILAAVQNIRFEMDEKGVRLRSESHVSIGCSSEPRPRHIMIFDAPFLLLMQRADSKRPYYAMWVDNAELMVKR
ncbi:MAG: hypothetical protein ABFD92_10385 [Planctomycetaceae bacterium]|nr:serpin family protein [Planctomycetaceae bacterium]